MTDSEWTLGADLALKDYKKGTIKVYKQGEFEIIAIEVDNLIHREERRGIFFRNKTR